MPAHTHRARPGTRRTHGLIAPASRSLCANEADEGLGDGDMPNDVQGATFGTDDREFLLRAERSGLGTGRVYTVTYSVQDGSGNSTVRQATVTVPFDMR